MIRPRLKAPGKTPPGHKPTSRKATYCNSPPKQIAPRYHRPFQFGAFNLRWRRATSERVCEKPQSLPQTRREEARMESTEGGAPMPHSHFTEAPQHHTHHATHLQHCCSLIESEGSPAFFPILILLSGDIETNPDPTYTCSTCNRPITTRQYTLQCNNRKYDIVTSRHIVRRS